MASIQRQIIRDTAGTPIGVLLPMEDYAAVKDILEAETKPNELKTNEEKVEMMKRAAKDPLFLADLEDTMHAFRHVDAEWWERSE